MIEIVAAAMFVLFIWWFSTGAVLHVSRTIRRPGSPFALIVSSLIFAGSLFGIAWSSSTLSVVSVVISFSCVIGVWGWHEYMFLTGLITGRHRDTCPEEASGFDRFRRAFAVLNHHELTLFASLAAIAALTWGAANPYGFLTFFLLWVMRLSAKFNLFFGVPHFGDELLPGHLDYLGSYFRKRPVTIFYWITLATSCLATLGLCAALVFSDALQRGDIIGLSILTSLLFLAIVEHAFMALPVKDTWLWQWAQAREVARSHPQSKLGTPTFGPSQTPPRTKPQSWPASSIGGRS